MGEKNSTEAIESSEVCYATLEQGHEGRFRPNCSNFWRRK